MTDPILYPVIGLLGGRCVRGLRDGESDPLLVEDDPIAVALRWREQGAQWLHIVDLDGAREGAPRQMDAIRAIIEAAGLPAQVAGGMRDTASVEAALAAGAERVILSAATPDDQALVARCVARWGERIAIALEARDGRVTVAGWLPSDAATALDVARAMGYLGAATLLFTSAVTSGESDPLPSQLRRALPETRLIAGGALTSLDDLRSLLALGLDGVLLGRALYDGIFTLGDALRVAGEVGALTPSLTAPDERASFGADSAPAGGAESAAALSPSMTASAEDTENVTTVVPVEPRAPIIPSEAIDSVETQEIPAIPTLPDQTDRPIEEPSAADFAGEDADSGE